MEKKLCSYDKYHVYQIQRLCKCGGLDHTLHSLNIYSKQTWKYTSCQYFGDSVTTSWECQTIISSEKYVQTQAQTKFIQHNTGTISGLHKFHKYTSNHIILMYRESYRHVGGPPLRSYLTAGMEATRKGRAYTVIIEYILQICVNWITVDRWTRVRDQVL